MFCIQYIVLTIWNEVWQAWLPAHKNLMVNYNDQMYRIVEAEYNWSTKKWQIKLRREWCDLKCGNVYVNNTECTSTMGISWTNFEGEWFNAHIPIAQSDGPLIDAAHALKENAGDRLLSLIDNFEQNYNIISNLYDEICENGLDWCFIRKNKRYDESGFAIEA